MTKRHDIEKALHFEPWESMLEKITFDEGKSTDNYSKDTKVPQPKISTESSELLMLSPEAKILGLDCVVRVDCQFKQRSLWTNLSMRQLENGKKELLNKQLIHEVFLGKSLFLAPAEKLFPLFGTESPYKRNTWELHSFLVLLASKLIEADPLVKYVKTEVSIKDSNSTVDALSVSKDGKRSAWEIVHKCTGNICANAAKLQDKGFSQIIFLCSDYETKQIVWTKVRNAGFDPDFRSIIRCKIFSTLIRQRKEAKLRGTQ